MAKIGIKFKKRKVFGNKYSEEIRSQAMLDEAVKYRVYLGIRYTGNDIY